MHYIFLCVINVTIANEILMHLRQNKKRQNDVSLQDSVGIDKEGNEVTLEEKLADEGKSVEEITTLKLRIEKLYKVMKERLTEREFEIVTLRYGLNGKKEKTQREIAKAMGISRSYVSRIETKALSKLKDL
ncbi:MAG: sigma-70 family RNA polymerase sigma factor [Clostridia bacterium]|nr:sigma-70 family RNA polymerase sigma factor [Clostridia bacterium]